MNSLLDEPNLAILITKNALRPRDHRCLNEVETDELFDNIMHSALGSDLCAYMAKEHSRVLRQEFEA